MAEPINNAAADIVEPINNAGVDVVEPINNAGAEVVEPTKSADADTVEPISNAGADIVEPLTKVDSAVQGLSSSPPKDPKEKAASRRKSSMVAGVASMKELCMFVIA